LKRVKIIISSCILVIAIVFLNIPQAASFTIPEYLNYETGCIPDDRVPVDIIDVPQSSGSLPSSCDLSEEPYFPCIRHQVGSSCSAWATTYYQFGFQVAQNNAWIAKNDPTKQMSPKFVYNLCNNGTDLGISLEEAYEVLSKQGSVPYSQFPSSSVNPLEHKEWFTDTEVMRQSLKYRVSEYTLARFSPPTEDTPINEGPESSCLNTMKSYLMSGHVLVISTYFYSWDYDHLPMQTDTELTNQLVCTKSVGYSGYHAMAVVGYNDDIWYDYNQDGIKQDNEMGAFKLANSHGTEYGNDGFIWVMYDALNTVSNFLSQNVPGRSRVFVNYRFNYIYVDNYPLDITVEVSLRQNNRSQIDVDLGISNTVSNTYTQSKDTILDYSGGTYSFNGDNQISEATFVFDYYSLVSLPTSYKNYYVSITDDIGNSDTYLESIKFVDSAQHTVVNDIINQSISSENVLKKYKIGLLGDVNNDGYVDGTDLNLVNYYIVHATNFNNDQLKTADVDGDGDINAIDLTFLNRKIYGIIDHLPAGVFTYLE